MPFLLILALCTLMGCKSAQPTALPAEVTQDSTHVHQVQFDSIYICKDRLIRREKDTVYLRETEVEYRYRLLCDTVRIVRCDSIPYPVTIVQTQEVKYTPWHIRTLAWVGAIALAAWVWKRRVG